MNTKRLLPLLGSLCGLASCSLSHVAEKSEPLRPGVRYEVRKALALDAPVKPTAAKSYFFMVDAPVWSPTDSYADLLGLKSIASHNVRTTAYCHEESDHIAYGNFAAIGKPLRFGSICSAAADWSRYPVGTVFRIPSQPGVLYEVDDYGSALVGSNTIDLYRPTLGSMNAWGTRQVDIEIVKWGSFEDSLRRMRPAALRYPHVRRMVDDIQKNLDHAGASSPIQTTPATATKAPATAA